MRHIVFAHRNFDLHAGVVHLAQHLLDATHRLTEQRRGLGQFDHHHLADFGQAGGGFGDHHILAITLVFGGHNPDAALAKQAADDDLGAALHDLDHAPLGTALAVAAHNAHLDAVLVQHGAHLVGRQVYIGLAIIPDHKAVPIAMPLNYSFNFFQQCAGLLGIFDTMPFFPEMPRWRNW